MHAAGPWQNWSSSGSSYMILPHGSWRVGTPGVQRSLTVRGGPFFPPTQRLPGRGGPSAGQSRGSMPPQAWQSDHVRQAELLGRRPWAACVSWLPLPLSLPRHLPLLRSRAFTADPANLHVARGGAGRQPQPTRPM